MAHDIFRDVEQTLRDDKLKAFWQKYRYVIIGFAVSIVIFVGVRGYYLDAVNEKLQTRSAEFDTIIQNSANEDSASQAKSLEEFALARKDAYSDFAWLYLARQKVAEGDQDGAVLAFNKIIAEGQEEIYIALARIEKAILFLEEGNYQESTLVLEPLLEEDELFRALALYYAALASLLQENYPTAEALAQSALQDPNISEELRILAQQIFIRAKSAPTSGS